MAAGLKDEFDFMPSSSNIGPFSIAMAIDSTFKVKVVVRTVSADTAAGLKVKSDLFRISDYCS